MLPIARHHTPGLFLLGPCMIQLDVVPLVRVEIVCPGRAGLPTWRATERLWQAARHFGGELGLA
jgi:hypothetical protein